MNQLKQKKNDFETLTFLISKTYNLLTPIKKHKKINRN